MNTYKKKISPGDDYPPGLEGLFEEIGKGKIAPVYLFSGEEEYLKSEALNRIKKILFSDSTAENFNYRVFYGEDLDWVDFLEEADTFPASSNKKLLVVREAEKLDKVSSDKISQALVNLPSFSHLIFFFQKVDKRRLLFQAVQKKGKCIHFYPLKDSHLRFWVRAKFKERKKEIKEDVLSFLLAQVGGQLQELEKEIEKLSVYVGTKPEVELNDLIAISSEYQTQDIYGLLGKLLEKDIQGSLKILSKLMPGKRRPEIIGLLFWQYARLYQAKVLQEKGASSSEISRKLNIPEYYLYKFLNQVSNFSKEELKGIFQRLLEADLNLKSTSLSPKLILELLLVNLCETELN